MSTKEPAATFTPIPGAAEGLRLIHDAFAEQMTGISRPSANAGNEVEKIEVVGSVVRAAVAEQAGLLHLNEVITYKGGAVDVVGYFPPPSSQSTISESAPLYADRVSASSFSALPENVRKDISSGRSHFSLDVPAARGQSLTQLAEAQDRQWQQYNKNPLPYDGVGEIYHNSNGALNASFRAVGRDDVSKKLVTALASETEHALQRDPLPMHLTADRVEIALVADRVRRGLPTAPGVSNPPTNAEIEGRGARNVGHAISTQARDFDGMVKIFDSGSRTLHTLTSAAGAALERTIETPANVRREFERGVDHFVDERVREQLRHLGVSELTPWNGRPREGRIVHSDDRVAILGTGRGAGVIFDVRHDLGGNQPPAGARVAVASDGVLAPRGASRTDDLGRG